MPEDKRQWQDRYKKGSTPWDTGRVDKNFIEAFEKKLLKPCKALEIGCGTGNNSLWFDKQGFDITGLDLSPLAIEKAIDKNCKTGGSCSFLALNILTDPLPKGPPFSLVFDRGCFHTFNSAHERALFAQKISENLIEDGIWFSLIASKDNPPRENGPPKRSVVDISEAVEAFFEIQSITTGYFDSNSPVAPMIWICLMKKRTRY